MHLDITIDETIIAAKDLIEQAEGRLDVLVNNAGGKHNIRFKLYTFFICFKGVPGSKPQYPVNWDVDLAESVFRINFFGVVQVISIFLPLIRKAKEGYGVILNVTSTIASNTIHAQGRFMRPGIVQSPFTAYSASKAALNSYTITLSQMLKPEGIKVNCATPGLVATKLSNFTAAGKTPTAGAQVLLPWVLLGPEDTDKHGELLIFLFDFCPTSFLSQVWWTSGMG